MEHPNKFSQEKHPAQNESLSWKGNIIKLNKKCFVNPNIYTFRYSMMNIQYTFFQYQFSKIIL